MSKMMQWTKPQLVVLTRGTPEEAVLTTCKHESDAAVAGPDQSIHHGCNKAKPNCGACLNRATS